MTLPLGYHKLLSIPLALLLLLLLATTWHVKEAQATPSSSVTPSARAASAAVAGSENPTVENRSAASLPERKKIKRVTITAAASAASAAAAAVASEAKETTAEKRTHTASNTSTDGKATTKPAADPKATAPSSSSSSAITTTTTVTTATSAATTTSTIATTTATATTTTTTATTTSTTTTTTTTTKKKSGKKGKKKGKKKAKKSASTELILPTLAAPGYVNISAARERVVGMFDFAYTNYLTHAFPKDELDPVHCVGRGPDKNVLNININDVLGNFSLTLIDSLDTLAVMGKRDEFINAVRLITETVSFDQDTNVQVFEVTIRVLGGLLAGHLIAIDPDFNMRPPGYTTELLDLAHDLGTRLLPAFADTPTGIPYPRVNLRHGVLKSWRNDTCTAGAGTLLLEFGVLGRLVNDPTYELVARRAALALFHHRSPHTGLLGNVIDMQTGAWLDQNSGMGAGSDSFYEYLYKAYVLFGRVEYLHLFNNLYDTSIKFSRDPNVPVFLNVNMHTGKLSNTWIDSLQAYVPALQVLTGEVQAAIHLHALYAEIWKRYGAMPERFNWHLRAPDIGIYPLRPELAEATYVLYRATRDPMYQRIGAMLVDDLQAHTLVKCGYATLHDVETFTHEDRMESFFLSETLKYLYLLFDESNILHTTASDHIFTTQAHVFRLRSEFHHALDRSMGSDEAAWAELDPSRAGQRSRKQQQRQGQKQTAIRSLGPPSVFRSSEATNAPWIANTVMVSDASTGSSLSLPESAKALSESNPRSSNALSESSTRSVTKTSKSKTASATTTTAATTQTLDHYQERHDTYGLVSGGRRPHVCEALPWWKRLLDPIGYQQRQQLKKLIRK